MSQTGVLYRVTSTTKNAVTLGVELENTSLIDVIADHNPKLIPEDTAQPGHIGYHRL